jgi:hypothetical protein
MKRILNWLVPIAAKFDKKTFFRKRLPIYGGALLILIVFGVKVFMLMVGLILAFFVGWTCKGLMQAFKDWRLSQRLNRVHFSAAEYEQMKRENAMLHEALQAYKENAKGRGSAGPSMAQAPPARPRFDPQMVQDMILQMREEGGT